MQLYFSIIQRHRCQCHQLRPMATTTSKTPSEEDDDKPLKYFGSQASSWKAHDGFRSGDHKDVVWYQNHVISGSLAIFLLYFCVFREENDVDRKLEVSLYDHVKGLEEQQLQIVYDYNLKNGLPVIEIEQRMLELKEQKAKASALQIE